MACRPAAVRQRALSLHSAETEARHRQGWFRLASLRRSTRAARVPERMERQDAMTPRLGFIARGAGRFPDCVEPVRRATATVCCVHVQPGTWVSTCSRISKKTLASWRHGVPTLRPGPGHNSHCPEDIVLALVGAPITPLRASPSAASRESRSRAGTRHRRRPRTPTARSSPRGRGGGSCRAAHRARRSAGTSRRSG